MTALVHRSVRFPVLLTVLYSLAATSKAQTAGTSAELKIGGSNVSTPLTLTVADLKKMPRKTLSVMNPHEKKNETDEGLPLQEILHRAGVPWPKK